jgi:DNA-binding NarL/FixJ family response regulator
MNQSISNSDQRAEVFMMPGLVLAVGFEPLLMTARMLVLQSAGYVVVRGSSLKETVDHLQSGDFDLVLLCHSVPATERERLISLIRESRSSIPIVSIARSLGECDALANATLEDGPNKFLAGIREVLLKAVNIPAA